MGQELITPKDLAQIPFSIFRLAQSNQHCHFITLYFTGSGRLDFRRIYGNISADCSFWVVKLKDGGGVAWDGSCFKLKLDTVAKAKFHRMRMPKNLIHKKIIQPAREAKD